MLVAYALCATIVYFIFGKYWLAFFGLFRMPMYHAMYPTQYLAVASLSYAAVASGWTLWRGNLNAGKRRTLWIWGVLVLSFALAATGWGVLLVYHDMMAGHFPDDWLARLLWGGMVGAAGGMLVFVQSIPSNVLMAVMMFMMASRLDSIAHRCVVWNGRGQRMTRYVFCGITIFGLTFAVAQFVGFFTTWVACRI